MKKKIVLLLSLIICLSLIATGCSSKKIQTDQLFIIEEKGANGYGYLELSLNREYAVELAREASGNTGRINSIGDLIPDQDPEMAENPVVEYINALNFKIDKNENLSNGDVVTIQIEDDSVLAESAKMQLDSKEFTYELSRLVEAEVYDAFADIELVFEGDDGEGYFYIDYLNYSAPVFVDFLFYDQDDNLIEYFLDGLSNGDQIKVVANYSEEDILNTGYILKEEEKIYTVAGLSEYEILDEQTLLDAAIFEFEGAAPRLDIYVENDLPKEIADHVSYYVNPAYGVKIGDIITLEIYVYNSSLKEAGYSFPQGEIYQEFELTADMVPQYISSIDDLTDEEKELIQAKADAAFEEVLEEYKSGYNYVNDDYVEINSVEEKGIDSVYFMYPKEEMLEVAYNINLVGFLYKVEFDVDDGDKLESYLYVYVHNLIKDPETGLDMEQVYVEDSYYFDVEDYVLENYIDYNAADYEIVELEKF